MENNWLSQVKRLHAIAETGLAFCDDPFDQERYEEIAQICCHLLADLASTPVDKIQNLVTPDIKRYVTPQVEVRAAVFEHNKILLVQEKEDGLWTLPGGYADVGLSPKQNAEKEVFEEAGIAINAQRIFSVRHKASGDYDEDIREFYKLFFICSKKDPEQTIKSGLETSNVGYFALDELPPLSTGRVIIRDIEDAFEAINNKNLLPAID